MDEINGFTCDCLDGFTGATCLTEIKDGVNCTDQADASCDCLDSTDFGSVCKIRNMSATIRIHWSLYIFVVISCFVL